MRTRILIFCPAHTVSEWPCHSVTRECRTHPFPSLLDVTYQVPGLSLVGVSLFLVQDVLLVERRAERVLDLLRRRAGHLHGALERGFGRFGRLRDVAGLAVVDVAEAHVSELALAI